MTGIVEKIRAVAALRREATPGPWWTGLGDQKVYGSRPRTGPTELLTAATYDAAYIAAAGSLTAEELEALADVVWIAESLASSDQGTNAKRIALRAALDRLQETTP